jgi:hypothetical protein
VVSDGLGVPDLVRALDELRHRFELDSVAAHRRDEEGHLLTLKVGAPGLLTIERDDGQVVAVPLNEVMGE